jgi:hypothetical protein
MVMAINRAGRNYYNMRLNEFSHVAGSTSSCIFISHKSEDVNAAIAIGHYIRDNAGIDIYLDILDEGLQGAVQRNDHHKIVKCIEKGIATSTHILCLISEKSNVSWWISYEIGYAKKAGKGIASMKLKNIDSMPSFLVIEKQIFNKKQLDEYLQSINGFSGLRESYSANINRYID